MSDQGPHRSHGSAERSHSTAPSPLSCKAPCAVVIRASRSSTKWTIGMACPGATAAQRAWIHRRRAAACWRARSSAAGAER
eukprot:1560450-Alexandrium_andersonii.AAC.1